MTNKEIVQALRICNRPKGHRCSECPIFSHYEHFNCKKTVDKYAADLIESLLAQLADSQQKERETAEERDALMRLHSRRVEVIRRRIDNDGLTPEEQRLLDDLVLPRHYDIRAPKEKGASE